MLVFLARKFLFHPITSREPMEVFKQSDIVLFILEDNWYECWRMKRMERNWTPAEPRDTCLLICLVLARGAARHLPAHLPGTRQRSRATPDRKSTRLNSSHSRKSRMPSSA